MALSDAFNEELHALADAGCPVIQMEEPQIHLVAVRGLTDDVINPEFMLKVFNNTVRGLRKKTEVWCHSCWGNPSQQRMFAKVQSYAPALEVMSRVDADVITFETCSSGGIDLEAIGKHIKEQKVGIGVIDHHTLQVERPEEVADLIRRALKHIPARAARHLLRLRHGPRRHEPPPRPVQDGLARPRHEHGAEGPRAPRGAEPRGRPALLARQLAAERPLLGDGGVVLPGPARRRDARPGLAAR